MTYELPTAAFETAPEERNVLFADLDSGEERTFYFKHQRVIKYGENVNSLFFYTKAEVHINAIGYNSAIVTIHVPHPFENSQYERYATFNVRAEDLLAVV